MNDINLHTWFTDRELDYCPKHFVKSNTVITKESKLWILERLTGRFYIQSQTIKMPTLNLPASLGRTVYPNFTDEVPYFEDPSEATLYELTWS
jgi:hypothetical protein